MSGKFGGGGTSCTICTKTVYPAETILLEKKPYHVECFRCITCNQKIPNASGGSLFEESLYCKSCFNKGGFAQKQKKVVWVKKESSTPSALASKFGGGGVKCTKCEKTVYSAEQLSFEKKPYHAACFACHFCEKKMSPNGAAQFEDADGAIVMCTKCFGEKGYRQKQVANTKKGGSTSNALASKFGGGGNKCEVCTKTVYAAETLSFEKKAYHAACFTCGECNKKMSPSDGNQFEDKLLCSKCFSSGGYSKKQTKTATTTTSSKTSSKLAGKFGGGGNKCVRCDKTVYPAETVSYEKNYFHSKCFTCTNCDCQLTTAGAEAKKDTLPNAYCKKCWGELGLNKATLN